MTAHLVGIAGLVAAIVLCIFYPFLPGSYDRFALSLSTMAQVFGVIGLLLVPMGGVWLRYEMRKRARLTTNVDIQPRRYYFVLVSLAVSSFVAVLTAFGALLSLSLSLALIALTSWLAVLIRMLPRLRTLKTTEPRHFSVVPIYLVVVPSVVFVLQLMLAAPARAFSRNRAIAQSTELIRDLETYHSAHGRYPTSLLAVNQDYHPSVVGIERFYYAFSGTGYDLFFERPGLLVDFGIREFVVYNNRDDHLMMSHAAWIVTGPPEQLRLRQGWFAVHDASVAHWKYFWFD